MSLKNHTWSDYDVSYKGPKFAAAYIDITLNPDIPVNDGIYFSKEDVLAMAKHFKIEVVK